MKIMAGICAWLLCGFLAIQLIIYSQPKRQITFGTAGLFMVTGPLSLVISLVVITGENLSTCVANCGQK